MCSTLYNDQCLKSNYVVIIILSLADRIFILTSAIETEIFIRTNVKMRIPIYIINSVRRPKQLTYSFANDDPEALLTFT